MWARYLLLLVNSPKIYCIENLSDRLISKIRNSKDDDDYVGFLERSSFFKSRDVSFEVFLDWFRVSLAFSPI